MVYCRGYNHAYAVHFITGRKLPIDEALDRARELLTKFDPKWNKFCILDHVGYERIPIDELKVNITNIDEIYYVVVRVDTDSREVEDYISTVPKELAEKIEKYRQRYITIDYDEDNDLSRGYLHDALNFLSRENIAREIKVYKTLHGYHVRAKLVSPHPLDMIIYIRGNVLYDDYNGYKRVKIDEAYLKSDLGFLTNVLFNEKYSLTVDKSGNVSIVEKSVEKEIDPRNIIVTRSMALYYDDLADANFKISTNKGVIEVRDNAIIFKGLFGINEMLEIDDKLTDILRKYREKLGIYEEKELRGKVIESFRKISPTLGSIISQCEIRYEKYCDLNQGSYRDDCIIIYVPEHLRKFVGYIIGPQGNNIKQVENAVGKKILVEGAVFHTFPQDAKKRREALRTLLGTRLQRMLKQLVQ